MSRNGSFENSVYGRAARTPFSAAMVAEPGQARAEVAVSAYCRELCGPASNRAVIAILDVLEHGPDAITEAELLRTTRATAARFAFAGLDGSRGKVTLTSSRACAPTPERLVASVSDRLLPHERHELARHLEDCLPCSAIRIKLDRAERGFAVLWSAPTVPDPLEAIAPEATYAPAEVAPAAIPMAPRLDAERATAAARAYCREACGSAGSEPAVAAILDTVEMQAQTVDEDELLRITRSAAAKRASRDIGAQVERDDSAAACPGATIALANLANGELRTTARRQLGAHVQHCLVCLATQVRMARAERAFATITATAPAREIESWFDLPAQSVRGRAAQVAAPPAPSPRRAAFAAAPSAVAVAAAGPFAESAAAAYTAAPAPAPTPPLSVSAPPPVPPEPGLPVEAGRPDRRRRIIVRRIVAAAVIDLAAAAVIATVVLSGHSHTPTVSSAATALHTKAAGPSVAPARTPAKAVSHKAKAKPVKHHVAAKAKPAHHAVKTHHVAKTHRAPAPKRAATPVRAVSVPAAPRVVAPRKVVSSPVASKPASTPTKPSTPSATPQGSTLPAQSAPTQGIGSNGG
jgi:hypothetical protein